MDFHAHLFAAALLALLLASRAADAAPRNENATAASSKRTPVPPAGPEVEGSQPQESALPLNVEEEEAQAPSPVSLCKLMPQLTPLEQQNCEAALKLPNLKERWDAVTSLLVKQIRAAAASGQGAKVAAILDKLNDPEVRNDLAWVALGAAGMAVTGLMLGNGAMLHQLALMSLYVTAFFHLMKSGANLASKLVAESSERGAFLKSDKATGEVVAKWIGSRRNDEPSTRIILDE